MQLKDLGNLTSAISGFIKTGSLVGSINDILSVSFKELNAAQILAKVSTLGLTDAQTLKLVKQYATDKANYGNIASIQALSTTQKAATVTTGGLSAATKGLGVQLKALAAAHPVLLAITATIAAIGIGYKIFDHFNVTVEEAAEAAQQSSEAWKSIKAEIDSLNTELETTATRIDELNAKDSLTIIEQEELERLKETNDELERSLAVQSALEKVASSEARDASKKYFNTKDSYTQYTGVSNEYEKYGTNMYESFSGSTLDVLEKQIQEYERITERKKELDKEISELVVSNPSDYESLDSYKGMSKELSAITAQMGHLEPVISSGITKLGEYDDSLLKGVDDTYITKIDGIYDAFSKVFDPENYSQDKFNELWDSKKFKPYKEELEELSISGKLSPEVLESNRNYQKLLEATGLTAKQVAEHINTISKQAEGAANSSYKLGESVIAWKAALDSDNVGKVYEELTAGLEEAKKLYDEGLVGTDDFKSYAKMLSPTGADDAENFAENYKKAMRYLEDADASGVQNFLVDLSKKTDDAGNAFATFDEKTKQWNINIKDTEEAAKALGTGTEVVEASMRRLSDYGFDVNWIDSLDTGAEKIAEYYAEIAELEANDTIEPNVKSEQIDILNDKINTTLSLMDELSEKDAFDFSTDIDNAKVSIQSYYDQIQKIMDGGVDLGGNEAKVVSKMYSKIQELAGESGIDLKADLKIDTTQVNEYLTKAGEETFINVDGEESTAVLEKITGLIGDVGTGVVDLGTKMIGDLGATVTTTKLQGVIDKLDAIRVKAEIPITQKVNVTRTESGTAQLSGTVPQLSARALALGSLSASGISGKAYASGTGRTTKDERALTGEEGQELVVNGNRWWTVGDNHVEFSDIPKGSVVFNAEQTKKLLSQGYAPRRGGSAYLSGTAYSGGVGASGSFEGGASKYNKSSSVGDAKKVAKANKETEKSAKEQVESFDWIERLLSNIEDKHKSISQIIDDETKSYESKQAAYDSMLTLSQEKLDTLQEASVEYERVWLEAIARISDEMIASLGLNTTKEEIINNIVNGSMKVEDFKLNEGASDAQKENFDSLMGMIKDSESAYDKLKDTQQEYADESVEIEKTRIEKYKAQQDQLSNKVDVISSSSDRIQDSIDELEARNQEATASMYADMIELSQQEEKLYRKKISLAKKALKNTKVGSEEYYRLKQEIADCESAISDCRQSQIEWNQSILEIPIKHLEKLNDELDKQIDKQQKVKDTLDSAISGVGNVLDEQQEALEKQQETSDKYYDDQIENLNKEKDAIQEQIDAIKEKNDEADRAVETEKKLAALEKAKTQKTKKVMKNGEYVWEVDQDAINKAQKDYDDQLVDNNLNDLEKQQSGIDDKISGLEEEKQTESDKYQDKLDELEEYRKKLDEIANAYQKDQDIKSAAEFLGMTEEELRNAILNKNLDLIGKINSAYQDNEARMDELSKTKEKNEELIGTFQDYITAWQNGTISIGEAKKKIQETVADNKLEIESIDTRIGSVDSYRSSWNNTRDSISNDLDEIETEEWESTETENEMWGTRIGQATEFANQFFTVMQNVNTSFAIQMDTLVQKATEAASALEEQAKRAKDAYRDMDNYESKSESSSGNSKPPKGSNSSGGSGNKPSGPASDPDLIGKHHDGIKSGFVGYSNSKSLEEIMTSLSMKPLKRDESLEILENGEGVFTEEQMGNMVQKYNYYSSLPVRPEYPELKQPVKEPVKQFNFGDINVTEAQNVTDIAKGIMKGQFGQALLQETYRRR